MLCSSMDARSVSFNPDLNGLFASTGSKTNVRQIRRRRCRIY